MRYFASFPWLSYSLAGTPFSQAITVRNVFFRLKIIDAIQQNSLVYYPYYIKDNETAEDIASRYYKDPNLYWVVFFANNIVNPWYDWPLSDSSLLNFINTKYNGVQLTTTNMYNSLALPNNGIPLSQMTPNNPIWYASFNTGLQTSIDQISVLLTCTNPASGGEMQIAIYADNNGVPGPQLNIPNVFIADSVANATPQVVTLNFSNPNAIQLTQDTQYWIGFQSVNNGINDSAIQLQTTASPYAGSTSSAVAPYTIGVNGQANVFPIIMSLSSNSSNNTNLTPGDNYGLSISQLLIDHYTLTVSKQDSVTGDITEQVVIIDQNTYNATPAFTFEEINLQDGSTVSITTTTDFVTSFQQELAKNEAKKQIHLLDKNYITEIATEFASLVSSTPDSVAS